MREYVPSRSGVLVTVMVVALTVSTVGVAAGSGTLALTRDTGDSSTNAMAMGTGDAVGAASASSTQAGTDDVEFVSAEEEASTDDEFSVDRPADVQEGDLLLLAVGGTANGENGMPYDQDDRWTRIDVCSQDDNGEDSCVDDGQDLFLQFYYTVATDDEPAAYDVNSGGNSVASITVLRGADTDDPIESVTPEIDDGDTADSICPSTDGVDGGMLVCGFTHDDQHELEDYDELTLRSEDENGDSSTQVATKELNDGGDTDDHVVDHVDPTGNKDIMMAVTVRPDSTDGSDDSSDDTGDGDTDTSGEGLHAIGGDTIEADYQPDFDVRWSDYVYFGHSVNGGDWEYDLMDEVDDNHFETTRDGLSDGDTIEYSFVYYENGWQYTDTETYTFQSDDGSDDSDDGSDDSDDSGPGTDRLVHGEDNELVLGEELESSNGDYRLHMQDSDGNLVLRDTSTGDAEWASDTAGDGGTHVKVQSDGNLVMYTDDSDAVWASDTAGSGANELVLEDDGALVLYDDGEEVWAVNDE